MKVICTLLLLLCLCSCKQKQEQLQRNPDDPNNYSLVIDYCEEDPPDSSLVVTGEEDFIHYYHLGIKGKTYQEIMDMYGTPLYKESYKIIIHTDVIYEGHFSIELASKLVRNCGKEVAVYFYTWAPRKNKDLYIMVFFVRDGNDLRAFYGEQLHHGSARYMLE